MNVFCMWAGCELRGPEHRVLWAELCRLKNSYVGVLTPAPLTGTVCGDRAFREVVTLEHSHEGGPELLWPVSYTRGIPDTARYRGETMWGHRERRHLQATKTPGTESDRTALRRDRTCPQVHPPPWGNASCNLSHTTCSSLLRQL